MKPAKLATCLTIGTFIVTLITDLALTLELGIIKSLPPIPISPYGKAYEL